MNDLFNSLLAPDGLRLGEGGAELGWAHPLPAWAWLLIIVGAFAVSSWSYAGVRAPGAARGALATLRALLLIVLALCAAGPRLERQRTEVEPDRLVILLDRSASMGVADRGGVSRDRQLRDALERHRAMWSSLAREKSVTWLGFDGGVVELPTGDDGLPAELSPAGGDRTAIGVAVGEALRRSAAHPLSGIVLLSDGRSADSVPAPTLRNLQADRVPVHAVPLGGSERGADFAVESATAPAVAFVEDTVPVVVRFTAEGIDASSPGRFEVVEDETGLAIERRELTADDLRAGEVTIPTRGVTPGAQRWTVRYIPDGPDLTGENNAASFAIRFVDRAIRVLYVDGSPRWEHRYLKSLLIREESTNASCLLLAVNRRYQQEGDIVLDALPEGAEEWDEFDVVILGDLSPELLGQRALADIRSLVGDQGAGLLWLAGPSATPWAWGETPLGDLLPVRPTGAGSGSSVGLWASPVVVRPTGLARRLGLFAELEQGPLGGIDDPRAGWSALRWALRLEPDALKAAAEPLAEGVPVEGGLEASPLIVSMRYGTGRTALVGTDEIWRWRYGRGEPPTERFWLPLLRMLARPRLATIGVPATLEVLPPIASLGQMVTVELTVIDQSIAEVAPGEVRATVTRSPAGDAPPATIRLVRQPGAPRGRALYAASFPALDPGSLSVRVLPDDLSGVVLETPLEVIAPDDELRHPQTDHEALGELARATGGRVFATDALDELPGYLPNRRIVLPRPPETTTLWDNAFTLALVLGLLTLEWVGRRLSRLT
jgi:hypothetical protein